MRIGRGPCEDRPRGRDDRRSAVIRREVGLAAAVLIALGGVTSDGSGLLLWTGAGLAAVALLLGSRRPDMLEVHGSDEEALVA